VKKYQDSLAGCLLAGLLLLGQASLLAHLSGHDINVNAAENFCAVCLGHSSLDNTCPPSTPVLTLNFAPDRLTVSQSCEFLPSPATRKQAARAPPSIS
jgi:hypothetical protein